MLRSPLQVRLELVKFIERVKRPKFSIQLHRLHWVLEVQRVHFARPTDGGIHGGLQLIDGNLAARGSIDEMIPVDRPWSVKSNPYDALMGQDDEGGGVRVDAVCGGSSDPGVLGGDIVAQAAAAGAAEAAAAAAAAASGDD